MAHAQVVTAGAKILSTEIPIAATDKLFELAGTRSTLAEHNLERHWRNARTHTLHDPVRWKYSILGSTARTAAARLELSPHRRTALPSGPLRCQTQQSAFSAKSPGHPRRAPSSISSPEDIAAQHGLSPSTYDIEDVGPPLKSWRGKL